MREDAAGHIFVEHPPVVRIRGVPRRGTVTLDGVLVGRGDWEGEVASGDHEVEVVAEGFHTQRKRFTVSANAVEEVVIELSPRPLVVVELTTAAAFGLLPGVGVARTCKPCEPGQSVGFISRLNAGYELPSGFQLGMAVGYLLATETVSYVESVIPVGGEENRGAIEETVWLKGFTVGAAAGFRDAGPKVPIMGRLGAGVLIGSIEDEREGFFESSTGVRYPARIAASAAASYLYVTLESRADFPLFHRCWLSLGGEFMLLGALSRSAVSSRTSLDAPGDGAASFGYDGEPLGASVMLFGVASAALRFSF